MTDFANEIIEYLNNHKSCTRWLISVRPDIYQWVLDQTTEFHNISLTERVHITLTDLPPKCSDGNYRKFIDREKGYRTCCYLGNKCKDTIDAKLTGMKNTMVEKYGVDNANNIKSAKEKRKQNSLIKFGYEHHSKNPDVKKKTINSRKARTPEQKQLEKEKRINTSLEKYGVDHHMKLQSQQEKVWQTNLEKYGATHPLQNPYIMERTRETFYQNNDIQDVVLTTKQNLMEKYGIDSVSRIGIDPIVIETLESTELLSEAINGKTTEEVAKELKISISTIQKYAQKYKITGLFRKAENSFEREVREWLSLVSDAVQCNSRYVIPPRELDFYIPEKKIAIECCGLYWHSEKSANRDREYHHDKYKQCYDQGIRLLTIFQDEWDLNKYKVKCQIMRYLDDYVGNFVCEEISTLLAKKFHTEYSMHDQIIIGSDHVGVFESRNLVAVLSYESEQITQFTTIRNNTLHHALQHISKPLKFIADNRWDDISEFINNGFVITNQTISYYQTDYKRRYLSLSIESAKYKDRIWDCGRTTLELNQ